MDEVESVVMYNIEHDRCPDIIDNWETESVFSDGDGLLSGQPTGGWGDDEDEDDDF
jgi:hypothetical protein